MRRRRILKWTGLVLCVVLVLGWGLSVELGVSYTQSRPNGIDYCVMVVDGSIIVEGANSIRPLGFDFFPSGEEQWRFVRLPVWDPPWWILCPLWVVVLLTAVPTAYLFYRDRCHPPGHCQRCGYNLTGNVSGRCSECGTSPGDGQLYTRVEC